MEQTAIVEQYKTARGFAKLAPMHREFIAGLSFMAPSFMTFLNWSKGSTVPLASTLKFAMSVYPAEDWRAKMARDLLEAQAGGVPVKV